MSSKLQIQDVAIPFGAIVLVTGCNGLLGSHCVDQFLAAGYKVRGTVRDVQRCKWMLDFFSKRYGDGVFELVEVKDLAKSGCFDDAVKGVAGIAHTASHVDMRATEPEPTIPMAIQSAVTALESAKKEPSLKRFVLTSSAWAAAAPHPDVDFSISEDTWNEDSLKAAYSKDPPPSGMQVFMAAKTKSERDAWKWVETNKPQFEFSTVLPDTIFGHILDPQAQGIPSTAGLVKWLFEGQNTDFIEFVEPQWFVDVVDAAQLHVAAMIDPGSKGVRILGHAQQFNWNDVLRIFRKEYPDRNFIDELKVGRDISKAANQRGDALLQKLYSHPWTTLEASITANVASFLDKDISGDVKW